MGPTKWVLPAILDFYQIKLLQTVHDTVTMHLQKAHHPLLLRPHASIYQCLDKLVGTHYLLSSCTMALSFSLLEGANGLPAYQPYILQSSPSSTALFFLQLRGVVSYQGSLYHFRYILYYRLNGTPH